MDQHSDVESRRRTARVLANAAEDELATLGEAWPDRPLVQYLRGPEAGLVMVQGRTGGTGDRFHLGEATVTRATVVVRSEHDDADEAVGTAYVLGSHPDHAGLAAIFDAMLASGRRDRVLADVIEPLERAQAERDARARAQARSTVVDFFTISRENEGARENSGADGEDDE